MWAWEIFGDYQLLDRLGEGGLSEVWRARCKDREVALKRFKSKEFTPSPLWEKFPQLLQHPNLVAMPRIGKEQDRYFAELALIEGSNLALLLEAQDRKQLSLSIEIATYIIKEIARGLAHLHAQALVHCDVSPQNILLSVDGDVFLNDFELILPQDTIPQLPDHGKQGYMSLAQRQHQAAQPSWDIFSLSVVFWELLTQHRLFADLSAPEILQQLATTLPKPSTQNTNTPNELDTLFPSLFDANCTAEELARLLPTTPTAKTELAALIQEHFPPRCKLPPRLSIASNDLTLPTTPAITTAQKAEALASLPMPLTHSQQYQALATTKPTLAAVEKELALSLAPTGQLPIFQPAAPNIANLSIPKNAPLVTSTEAPKPFVPDFRRFDVPQEPVLRPIRIVPEQEGEDEEDEEETRPMFDIQEDGGSLTLWIGALLVLVAILGAGFFFLLR